MLIEGFVKAVLAALLACVGFLLAKSRLFRWWCSSQQSKGPHADLRQKHPGKTFIGFFHPYCNAGGGGERVLWVAGK